MSDINWKPIIKAPFQEILVGRNRQVEGFYFTRGYVRNGKVCADTKLCTVAKCVNPYLDPPVGTMCCPEEWCTVEEWEQNDE